MASYADARRHDGAWLVRIEDVDRPRARPRAADAILAALEGYGFEWDEDVWRQSARTPAYEAALAKLVADGAAYPCVCSRRELAAGRASAIGERVYKGTCRKGIGDRDASRAAMRVRVPAQAIAFVDRVFGEMRQRLDVDVGDFIVRRSDGLFAYQLAVVVDDGAQRITDVVRGADLLTSTPRQILLQRLLGLPTPGYLHVPVAVDARGRKLSKQTQAAALPPTPLPALLAAWRFLGQAAPPVDVGSVREFWSWASANWRVSAIPSTSTRSVESPIV
jgi:glutamyl-Q tRNA(Asp) synthetase